MRSAAEIREHVLTSLRAALKRPWMWGGESTLRYLLNELAFIDEKEESHKAGWAELSSRGYTGSMWITSPFWRVFSGNESSFTNEVASVYAFLAYDLGYFPLDRHLDDSEWKRMRKGLRRRCRERDWTSDQVLDEFGPASYSVGGGRTQVHCYSTGCVADQWIYFDFVDFPRDGSPQANASGWNSQLRDVRLPAKSFSRGLVLTPFGRAAVLRPIGNL